MKVLQLLLHGAGERPLHAAGLSLLAGLCMIAGLVLVVEAPALVARHELLRLGSFALATLIGVLAAKQGGALLTEAFERGLEGFGLKLLGKLRGAGSARLEELERAELLGLVAERISELSLAGAVFVSGLQSLSVLLFSLLYLAYLSPLVLGLEAVVLVGCAWILHARLHDPARPLGQRQRQLQSCTARLIDISLGAEQLKLGRARAEDALRALRESSTQLRDLSVEVTLQQDDDERLIVLSQFSTLGVLVFSLPAIIGTDPQQLAALVVASMFTWVSLSASLRGYGKYVEVNAALAELEDLGSTFQVDSSDESH